MEFQLNDAQTSAQQVARTMAEGALSRDAVMLDGTETFPSSNLRDLGRERLLGINIDEAYGGRGAGVVSYVLAVRELAQGCAATTVAMMVTNMVAEAIQGFGNDAQREHYLTAICRGDWPAYAFSLSEPGSGSDAASLRTTAVLDGEHYVLNGTKAWVTSGGHSGVYLVMASTDPSKRSRGISAFLVDPGLPGFTVGRPEEKMGLRGSATTELVFEECRVPRSARLGEEGIGFKIAMSSLDGGRVGVSAQACGIATAALNVGRSWVAEQHAVSDAVQADWYRLLADSAADLEAGWLLCLRAASLKDAGKPLTRQAAVSKMYCTEMANRVCERILRIVGPAHGDAAATVQRHARDARVTRIYEGTSEVQRIVIAREILNSVTTGGKVPS